MLLRSALKIVLACLPICCLVGCGGSEESFSRVAVSGTMSVDGDANVSGGVVAMADIETDADNTGRPNANARIENGKFTFDAANGPTAGAYLFEISITVPDEATEDSGEADPEDASETGGNVVVYQKRVTIPEGGSESLTVELTSSDLLGESGETPSGEREE